MIEFVEDEPARLKFIARPYTKLFTYSLLLIVLLPLFYWTVFIAPASSALNCQRNSSRINCLLEEKSLLGFTLRSQEINNIKRLNKYIFGLSDSSHITFITASNLAKFQLFGSRQKYKYPSKSINLLTMNPQFGFKLMNQRKQLKQFIEGELPQQSLNLKVQLGWFVIFLNPVLIMPLVAINWIFRLAIETLYDFDGANKKLTISVRRIFGREEKSYSFDRIKQVFIDKENLDLGGRIVLQFIPEYNYPIEEYLNPDYGETIWQKINEFIEQYK